MQIEMERQKFRETDKYAEIEGQRQTCRDRQTEDTAEHVEPATTATKAAAHTPALPVLDPRSLQPLLTKGGNRHAPLSLSRPPLSPPPAVYVEQAPHTL